MAAGIDLAPEEPDFPPAGLESPAVSAPADGAWLQWARPRLAPASLPLFAAGAVNIEELARRQMRLRWLPAAAVLLVLVSMGIVAPLALLLLSPGNRGLGPVRC